MYCKLLYEEGESIMPDEKMKQKLTLNDKLYYLATSGFLGGSSDTDIAVKELVDYIKENYTPKQKGIDKDTTRADEMDRIAKEYDLKVIRRSKLCDDNAGALADIVIHLGKFDNLDLEMVAFFHEIGHFIYSFPSFCFLSKECMAWERGFVIARKHGYIWEYNSDEMKWARKQLRTYINGEYDDTKQKVLSHSDIVAILHPLINSAEGKSFVSNSEIADALLNAGQIPKDKCLSREDLIKALKPFSWKELNGRAVISVQLEEVVDALMSAGQIKKVDVEKKKITLKNAQPLIDKIKKSLADYLKGKETNDTA